MGLLSNIFGSSSVEGRLEATYAPILQATMGVSVREAKRLCRDLIAQAKAEARAEGTDDLPADLGDQLLKRERASNAEAVAMLSKKRAEGVRDEDIRRWWNMHDLERRLMLKNDDTSRMGVFLWALDQGLSKEAAADKVRRTFPMFGDPADESHSAGDDRPLPDELKDRINRYVERRQKSDADQFKRDVEESSSFNALVRAEVRSGNL
jgi:hypothetical protein